MKFLFYIAVVVGLYLVVLAYAPAVDAQEELPDQYALSTACASAANLAAIANLSMTKCRRVAEEYQGNTALVTVKVWIAGQGQFIVSVVLYKSIWGQQNISVNPA
jgi:hypothetical protein